MVKQDDLERIYSRIGKTISDWELSRTVSQWEIPQKSHSNYKLDNLRGKASSNADGRLT